VPVELLLRVTVTAVTGSAVLLEASSVVTVASVDEQEPAETLSGPAVNTSWLAPILNAGELVAEVRPVLAAVR
jgi:hypothetical protein